MSLFKLSASMHYLTIILILLASAVSANINIVWQHAKLFGKTALSIYDGSTIIDQSYSSFISNDYNSFDFSDVDENGFGNFTINDKQYLVHSKVECSGIRWKPSPRAKVEDNCHIDKDTKTLVRPLAFKGFAPSMIKREASPIDMPSGCGYSSSTSLVGDGKCLDSSIQARN